MRHIRVKLGARTCTIAYFGTSVTLQRHGYRPRLHDWLVRSTAQPHRAVNAALGAVGSMSAVFAMDDLVVRHRPDVCFVELSAGDIEARSPLSQLGPVVEGITRKLLDIGCAPIFLHFYRFDRSFDPPDPVVSTHESVAAHYGVPSINVGRAVERSLAGGKERLTAWFTDGIHMTDAGAEYVTELLGTALRTLFEDGIESAVSRTPLPTPLHERNYQNTMVVPASAAMLRHPQRCTAGSLRFVYPYIRFESDNEMEFADEGELAGIIVVVGRESGVIRIRTGSTEREIPLWDEYAFYDRYGTVLFDPPLPPRTALSLRLTDAAVDYSPCVRPLGDTATIRKQLKVIGFMVRP